MTFQEKLKLFKSGTVGFRVDSQDVADELVKVFEREGIKGLSNSKVITNCAFEYYGDNGGVVIIDGNLMFGNASEYPDKSFKFLKLTPEEIG